VPLRTLERACSQDGWRRAVKESGGLVAAVSAEVAAREGERIGLIATELVDRTQALTERLLGEIERKLITGQLSVARLRNLIAGFKDCVAVGRQSSGLDDRQPQMHLHYYGSGKRTVPLPVMVQ